MIVRGAVVVLVVVITFVMVEYFVVARFSWRCGFARTAVTKREEVREALVKYMLKDCGGVFDENEILVLMKVVCERDAAW